MLRRCRGLDTFTAGACAVRLSGWQLQWHLKQHDVEVVRGDLERRRLHAVADRRACELQGQARSYVDRSAVSWYWSTPPAMPWHALTAGCTLRCRELSASVPACIASCVPTLNTLQDTPMAALGRTSGYERRGPNMSHGQQRSSSNRTNHDPTSTCGTCASQSVGLTKAQLVVASVCAKHQSHQ